MDYFAPQVISFLRENCPLKPKPFYDGLVRFLDLFGSGLGLIFLSPVMGGLALRIKFDDGGPVFFSQERLGWHGVPFRILKFRSMVVQAEQMGAKWRMTRDDPRVTRVGRFLRNYHLDELPQLVNVWRGEMSLVGPRPALVFQKDYYESWEMPRLAVRPGLTGLSQVSGGNELNWDQRILIDVYYVRYRSLRLLFSILIRTFFQLFVKKGIHAAEGGVKGWTRPLPEWYREKETGLSRPVKGE